MLRCLLSAFKFIIWTAWPVWGALQYERNTMWCNENEPKGNSENKQNTSISQNDTCLEKANTNTVENQHQLEVPISATLLALLSAGVACFFQHIIYQMPSFTIPDTSLLTCWVIGLFHWLKWRTRQVNKCLRAAVINLRALLEAPIQRLPRDQPVTLLGGAEPKVGSV